MPRETYGRIENAIVAHLRATGHSDTVAEQFGKFYNNGNIRGWIGPDGFAFEYFGRPDMEIGEAFAGKIRRIKGYRYTQYKMHLSRAEAAELLGFGLVRRITIYQQKQERIQAKSLQTMVESSRPRQVIRLCDLLPDDSE